MLIDFFKKFRLIYQKNVYRNGANLCHFIAKDIRRDVQLVDASEIDIGFVIARVRTWNVLHVSKRIVVMPEFSEPKRIRIEDMWRWKGAPWGGPVSDELPISKV